MQVTSRSLCLLAALLTCAESAQSTDYLGQNLVSDIPVRSIEVQDVVSRIVALKQRSTLFKSTLAQGMDRSLRGWVCESPDEVIGFAMVDTEENELTDTTGAMRPRKAFLVKSTP